MRCELQGERIQTVERIQIAKKSCCQTLVIDDRLRQRPEGAGYARTVPMRDGARFRG